VRRPAETGLRVRSIQPKTFGGGAEVLGQRAGQGFAEVMLSTRFTGSSTSSTGVSSSTVVSSPGEYQVRDENAAFQRLDAQLIPKSVRLD
jgi:hypothetical protein